MKRTTYIMLGVVAAGVIAIFASVFYLSTQKNENNRFVNINGKNITQALGNYKAVKIEEMGDSAVYTNMREVKLNIEPSTDESMTITMPEGWKKYITVKAEGDTLNLVVKISKKGDLKILNVMSAAPITLRIPKKVQSITSAISVTTIVNLIKQDTLSLSMNGDVKIEKSNFKALNVRGGNLTFASGSIGKMYYDYDSEGAWNVASGFKIDTAYLTGSKNDIEVEENGCKSIVWIPKTKDAKMQIKVNRPVKMEF